MRIAMEFNDECTHTHTIHYMFYRSAIGHALSLLLFDHPYYIVRHLKAPKIPIA